MPEDTSPAPAKKNLNQHIKNMSKKQLMYVVIAAVIFCFGLIALVLYRVGYDNGKNDQAATVSPNSTPNKALVTLPASGTVDSISDSSIRIKLLGDQTREAIINSDTQVSTKDGSATVKDITAKSKVILFTKKDGAKSIATRIVIQ